jgi:hypothetical protein
MRESIRITYNSFFYKEQINVLLASSSYYITCLLHVQVCVISLKCRKLISYHLTVFLNNKLKVSNIVQNYFLLYMRCAVLCPSG